MKRTQEAPIIEFPVALFPVGEIAPPMEPDHPTWKLMGPWTDPMAERGAYNTPSGKKCVLTAHGKAIEFGGGRKLYGVVTGGMEWKNARLTCRLIPVDHDLPCGPYDDWHLKHGHAGLAFRIETSRRYYFFCIETASRLVLYRRMDADWHVLDWKRIDPVDGPVTLEVELTDDLIVARCPERGVEIRASDATFPFGRMGFRSLACNQLLELRIEVSAEEQAHITERTEAKQVETARLGRDVPDAVPAGDLELDGASLAYANFVDAGRNDFLLRGADGLRARTWDGRVLWRSSEVPIIVRLGPIRPDGGRRIYLMTGERSVYQGKTVGGGADNRTVADEVVVLDGRDGTELMRMKLPEDPSPPGTLTLFDLSVEVGCAGAPGEVDFVVRQWRGDCGDGGKDLWAYDPAGRLLWQRQVGVPYGHTGAVHCADVNRDGELEVLAGGTCYTAAGDVIWRHDLEDEMRRISGAGHYDAMLVQPPEAWEHAPPVVIGIGGSAGVYVVDALTGRTRAIYRVGHAQWGNWCRLRDDLPAPQFMVGTRWTNYGILTLFNAAGERLWAIQPDYVLQGSGAVRWCAAGPGHLWINTSEMGMGLYDGHGRMVKPLDALRAVFRGKTRMQVGAFALEREPGGRHWLALSEGGRARLFKPRE